MNENLFNSITDNELILFSNFLQKNCGIVIPAEKAYMFETRLSKMMADAGYDTFGDFYRYVAADTTGVLTQQVIDAMTVNETLWFRNETPWQVLEQRLPGFIDDLRCGKKLKVRIWSAAVSTGQEIYSTVMCIDNYLKRHLINDIKLSDFEFIATDISSRVLSIAKRGRYDAISIKRGLSDYYRQLYFTYDNNAWNIDERIRESVKFNSFNLKTSFYSMGQFDIIFCRYVLIYFSDQLKKEVISKLGMSLIDQGILFTGNYALYDFFEQDFCTEDFANYTYYVKRMMD